VAQRVGRGIALLFHDCGNRRGRVVSSTPWPHFTPGEGPGTHFTGGWADGKSCPHRDSIPDRPVCSQSLYRLSYPVHNECCMYVQSVTCSHLSSPASNLFTTSVCTNIMLLFKLNLDFSPALSLVCLFQMLSDRYLCILS